MTTKTAEVGILMGSASDLETMKETQKILDDFGIVSEIKILSAHRTPEMATDYAKGAGKRGLRVIIAGAGMANHLAGTIAAHTLLPVIGVPLDSGSVQGLDALLSTVQMPPGIPVATVAIGRAGAKNAAYLAVEILALGDRNLQSKLQSLREKQKEMIKKMNKEIA